MKKKFNVLILHSFLGDSDGSSLALKTLLDDLTFIENYTIITLRNQTKNLGLKNIIEVKSYEEFEKILLNGNFDLIHNFRLIGDSLILWALKFKRKSKQNLPILTTINQNPSFIPSLLHPKEIKNSYTLVFIDSSAYNNSLVKWIPERKKRVIYYVTSIRDRKYYPLYKLRSENKTLKDNIVYGRGSTLIKCPKDIIENFQQIDVDNKRFVIYGIPEDSWLNKESKQYKNVETIPMMPLEEWVEALSDVDIFLYQLPLNSHSSLDGTLGTAMYLGIPVVYYGPEAPKERFIHGENGYIAETKEDFIKYASILGKDSELRKRIGEAGHKSTVEQFDWHKTVEAYRKLYEEASLRGNEKIQVQISYIMKYFFLKIKNKIKYELHKIKRR